MAIRAVRGAVQLENNSAEAMRSGVHRLLEQLLERNGITESDIVSIIFSQTSDLTAENPARALRRSGFASTPLFCTSEPEYPDSLPRTLRVLVTFGSDSTTEPKPVYLDGARGLRPDIPGPA
ncbi:MAG: chorismate mutase [Spirochaetes bacterium]|jgi:chorismate mutase|nr:chorismate mutase [Spirochaetota bacterium]